MPPKAQIAAATPPAETTPPSLRHNDGKGKVVPLRPAYDDAANALLNILGQGRQFEQYLVQREMLRKNLAAAPSCEAIPAPAQQERPLYQTRYFELKF